MTRSKDALCSPTRPLGAHHARSVSALVGIAICATTASAAAQSAKEMRGAAPVEPVANEPRAKIVADPPLAEPLSRGRVVIQYRTENLHIVPVFGAAALAVSPRVGHIHVTVDDSPWVWADASGEPVVLDGLPRGPHKVMLQLETPNHQLLDQDVVAFTVPEARRAGGAVAAPPAGSDPPAKLIIDSPAAEPLARGVAFISYRTDHLHVVPVYGVAALAISPRVGHIHVTVDDAAWHWADASGNPVIINGLSSGRHKVLIELVNADHQVLDQGAVQLLVPAAKPMAGH